MKKLIKLILALLLCFTTLPAACRAESSSPLSLVKNMLSKCFELFEKRPQPSKELSEQEQLKEQLKKEKSARMDAIFRGMKAAEMLENAEKRMAQQQAKRRKPSTETAEQTAHHKAQLEKKLKIAQLKENLRLAMEDDDTYRKAAEKTESILHKIRDQKYQEERRQAQERALEARRKAAIYATTAEQSLKQSPTPKPQQPLLATKIGPKVSDEDLLEMYEQNQIKKDELLARNETFLTISTDENGNFFVEDITDEIHDLGAPIFFDKYLF